MAGDWVDDPDSSVEHVLSLLPEPFQSVTCWWSLSSSAAVPCKTGREVSGTFKLKLPFWLDRALTGAEVKRWMGCDRHGTPRSNRNMSEAADLRAQVIEFLEMLPGDVLLVSYKAVIEAEYR
jgi:hypothetical protein